MNIYSQLTTPVLAMAKFRSRSLFEAVSQMYSAEFFSPSDTLYISISIPIDINIKIYLQLTIPVLVFAMVRSRSLFDAVSRMYSAEFFSPGDTLYLSMSAHIHIHIHIYIYISLLPSWSSPWCGRGRSSTRSLECMPPPPSSFPPATPYIYISISIPIDIHIKIYSQLTTPVLVFAMVRSRSLFDAVSRMYCATAEFFSPSDTASGCSGATTT